MTFPPFPPSGSSFMGISPGIRVPAMRGGKKASPIRFVSYANSIYKSLENLSGATRKADRFPIIFACDTKRFRVGLPGWYLPYTSTNPGVSQGYVAPLPAYSVVGASVELDGVVARLTWDGNATPTVPSGSDTLWSDWVLPSDIGLSGAIPKHTQAWVKTDKLGTAGQSWGVASRSVYDVTGGQSLFFNPDTNVMSDVMTPGVFTYTGTIGKSQKVGMPPLVIGEPVNPNQRALIGLGDSITENTGDLTSYNAWGQGYFLRAAGLLGLPSFNAGVGSSGARCGYRAPELLNLYQYATDAMMMFGTNDFEDFGATYATHNANMAERIATLRARGIRTVGIGRLPPRTTSTDNWATLENQSPRTGWGSGDPPYNYSTDIEANLDLDYVIPHTAMHDATDYWRWAVSGVGTIRWMTRDGTHPETRACIASAEEIATIAAPFLG